MTSAVLVIGVLGASGGAQQQPPAQPATPPAQPAAPAGQPSTPPADQADQQPQPPNFRGEVNFVRVDAIVTDKAGKPVLNLKPEDFEITEAGKPQKIETFKVVSLDGGLMPGPNGPPATIRTDADEEREAARDNVRLFGLFLDDYHVTRDNSRMARSQIARFVQTQLGPSDMIGLMMPLDPLSAVRMTRNHDAVMRGVMEFEGRKYDYTPRTPAEERWMYTASAETIERLRNEASIGAIKALIMRMGGLKEGRKALILVSEGYSNTLPPQMRDPIAGQPGYMNPAANDPMAGTGADANAEFRRQAFTSMDMDIYLREVTDLANKNNVSIYAVDPRGLATNEFGIEKNINMRTDNQFLRQTLETLKMISEDTDGRAIVNNNEILVGMKQIVLDSSAYYLLGYSSNVGSFDGKFHPINVRIKNRRDLEIRHRTGYWALKPDEAARLNAPVTIKPPSAVEAAIASTAAPRTRLVRTWIGTARGENGRTRVTISWETVPRVPGQPVRDSERPARLSVSAVSADGAPLFKGAAPEAAASAPPATGVSQKVTFEAPPGKIQMRLAVEGVGAELLDSETREFTVPDLTSPQLAFGTPEVFRARTTPEFQKMRSDPAASPSAGRDFNRTDRLLVRVPVYGPGAKVTARLLNRGGQSMAEIPVTTPPGGGLATLDVGLTSLANGDYGIEITATADGADVKELIAFRLVS